MGRARPRERGLTERQVSEQVVAAAALFGVRMVRRNVGVGLGPTSGQRVRFNEPGDADYSAVLPGGIALACEVKSQGFDPARLRGKSREHFERQLRKLRDLNRQGGVAFWCDNVHDFITILRHVLAGGRVEEPGYGPPVILPATGRDGERWPTPGQGT
jgi:hypothetical protein